MNDTQKKALLDKLLRTRGEIEVFVADVRNSGVDFSAGDNEWNGIMYRLEEARRDLIDLKIDYNYGLKGQVAGVGAQPS